MNAERSVALVAGRNEADGERLAEELARRGFTVYLGGRHIGRARDAAAELRRGGLAVTALGIDSTDVESVGRAAARILERHGRLDLLVNDAAGAHETDESGLFGLIFVTGAMLPLLRRSATPQIVNIVTTAAATMLSVQYAETLRRRPEYGHIQVHAVTPGLVAAALDGPLAAPAVDGGVVVSARS